MPRVVERQLAPSRNQRLPSHLNQVPQSWQNRSSSW
jgi:hypothetical protein